MMIKGQGSVGSQVVQLAFPTLAMVHKRSEIRRLLYLALSEENSYVGGGPS